MTRAKNDGPAILAQLAVIEAALVKAGVHPTSPYWRKAHRRKYGHPTARLEIQMVGRGGDKTRDSVVEGIAETTAGAHEVPRGERHYFTHLSENIAEASKTLGIYEQYLRILKIPHTRTGDTIELGKMPRGIKVLSARVGAVSGWRCFGWTADEVAKWRDADTGANPAGEVIASVRAMTVTHPNARGRMRSSPMGKTGLFYESWKRGDTAAQLVGHAPTWIANPSVSEEHTLSLEPDPRIWAREYAAQAQAGVLAAFDYDKVLRCWTHTENIVAYGEPIVAIDPSEGKSDGYAWSVVSRCRTDKGRDMIVVSYIDGLAGKFWDQIGSDEVVARIAGVARHWGAKTIHSDPRNEFGLRDAFRRVGLSFRAHNWTEGSKIEAVARLRRWLADEQLIIAVPHEKMRQELLDFEEVIDARTGQLKFGARGRKHDDFVATLITACMADLSYGMRPPKRPPPPESLVPRVLVTNFSVIDGMMTEFFSDGSRRVRPIPYGDE
jgi:hypothetical protein